MVQTINVTVDNVSPLITYSPPEAWDQGDNTDPYLNRYYNSTYTSTTQLGAAASLSFNGTSVVIYGAETPYIADFNVTFDGRPSFGDVNPTTNLFQQVLFNGSDGASSRPHSVSIIDSTADRTKYLNVDFIVYTVEVPDGYNRIKQEDTDTKVFKYSSSDWGTNPDGVSGYSGGTGHTTSAASAYVVYSFEGTHVEIYGAVGPSHGMYTVQVDGGTTVTLNGTNGNLYPQVLLFQDNSLAPGTHSVKVSNSPFPGQTLTIDFAVIYSSKSSDSSSSLSGGTIGGIAVGACAVILLVLFGAFFWWRRHRRRPGTAHPEVPPSTIPTGPVTFHTPSLPATTGQSPTPTGYTSSNPSLLQPSSSINPTPSPPHSNSSTSNSDSRSRLILHNPNPSGHDGPQGSLQGLFSVLEDDIPNQNPAQATRPLPQPGRSNSNTLSPTRTFVLAPVVEGNLRNIRLQVEGRSQDFGPVTFLPDPEHDGNLLPPDYNQATQPFPTQQR